MHHGHIAGCTSWHWRCCATCHRGTGVHPSLYTRPFRLPMHRLETLKNCVRPGHSSQDHIYQTNPLLLHIYTHGDSHLQTHITLDARQLVPLCARPCTNPLTPSPSSLCVQAALPGVGGIVDITETGSSLRANKLKVRYIQWELGYTHIITVL